MKFMCLLHQSFLFLIICIFNVLFTYIFESIQNINGQSIIDVFANYKFETVQY